MKGMQSDKYPANKPMSQLAFSGNSSADWSEQWCRWLKYCCYWCFKDEVSWTDSPMSVLVLSTTSFDSECVFFLGLLLKTLVTCCCLCETLQIHLSNVDWYLHWQRKHMVRDGGSSLYTTLLGGVDTTSFSPALWQTRCRDESTSWSISLYDTLFL